MMNDRQPGITERELKHLIDTIPLAYRRESMQTIEKVEAALAVSGITACTWLDALNIYRKRKSAVTLADMAKSGTVVFHPVLTGYLRDLDHAFRRIREFKPKEFMTIGVKSATARLARTGSVNDDNGKAERMIVELGYLTAKRGHKKSIKGRIEEETSLSSRQIDYLVQKLKNQKK